MPTLIDLTGKRFGRLTVLERSGTWHSPDGISTVPVWHCRCDCGKETYVTGRNLKGGLTRSCGCLRSEKAKQNIRLLHAKA